MKNLAFKIGILIFMILFSWNIQAQETMVLNPNDNQCVVRAYPRMGGVRGNMNKVVISIDNGQKYYYEYNWKTKTGYQGQKISWEKDVMQIAYDACKYGKSLESLGFNKLNN